MKSGVYRVSGGCLASSSRYLGSKGSSVPIALEGPDNWCSHSLETGSGKLFPKYEVGSHAQNYVI